MDKLTYSTDSKLRKQFAKPLLLKDYLLEDLSSCSSNGFRSYPRRQCCTTVRFLLDIDLNKNKQSFNKKPQQLLQRSRSKSASSATMSALQRASEKILLAVRSLPFAGVRSQSKSKKAVLPRSLSRKLLRRSFWKKTDHKEIERWKSFGELLAEEPELEDFKPTITAAAAAAGTDSNSSTSNSKSNSWSDSDFTASSDNVQCSSGNSEVNHGENDTVESKKLVGKRVGVTTATTAANYSAETTTKKEWLNEEKEQFSPVSVMDFPCDGDDEDEVSSPFRRRLVHIEGTKKSLMHKLRRFESLAKLEPVDLEKRIAESESDQKSAECIPQPCTFSIQEEEKEAERKAEALLLQMKLAAPSFSFKFKGVENLLLEFFQERLRKGNEQHDKEMLEVANDWMDGEPRESVKGWELQENRQAYIRDMENGGMWSKYGDEEKQDVGLEIEEEVFNSLLNEISLDLLVS